MTKLQLPPLPVYLGKDENILVAEEEYRAIQREAAIWALEEAAKLATATVCDTHLPTGVKIYGTRAGAAIRALKGKINE